MLGMTRFITQNIIPRIAEKMLRISSFDHFLCGNCRHIQGISILVQVHFNILNPSDISWSTRAADFQALRSADHHKMSSFIFSGCQLGNQSRQSLDFVTNSKFKFDHLKNWRPSVLKGMSPSMRSFVSLADIGLSRIESKSASRRKIERAFSKKSLRLHKREGLKKVVQAANSCESFSFSAESAGGDVSGASCGGHTTVGGKCDIKATLNRQAYSTISIG
jgi:hypothetical protein